MKITTLFFRSILFFQIKILFAAEKDTQQTALQPSRTLTPPSPIEEQSCNIDGNAEATNSVTEEETTGTETGGTEVEGAEGTETEGAAGTESEDTEDIEEKKSNVCLPGVCNLYNNLRLEYEEAHGNIFPQFDVNESEILIFNKIIFSLDLFSYLDIENKRMFCIEMENQMKEVMQTSKENFQKFMSKIRPLIKEEKPKVENAETEAYLRKAYKHFDFLNWSYFNENIVSEAESIFGKMKWTTPLPKKTNVLNVPLYHKLYNLMNNLKGNILNLNKQLKHFQLLKRSYNCTVQNALLRPLSMFLPQHRTDIFTKLHSELQKFNSHCDDALKTESKRLSDQNNYLDLVDSIKSVLKYIDEHMRMYNKVVTTSLQKEKKKSGDLLISLVVHFFKFLKDSNTKQQNILKETWELDNKSEMENLLEILEEEQARLDATYNSSLEILKKTIKKSPKEKQLKYFSNDLMNFAKYYMKILALSKLKNELLFFLDYLKKNISIHYLSEIPAEHVPTEKFTFEVIEESGTSTVKIVLSETSKIISRIIDIANMEKTLNSNNIEELRMHSLIRKLQFHLGSACAYCSEIRERPGYEKGSEQYLENLKKMLHCFWNANAAINEYDEFNKKS